MAAGVPAPVGGDAGVLDGLPVGEGDGAAHAGEVELQLLLLLEAQGEGAGVAAPHLVTLRPAPVAEPPRPAPADHHALVPDVGAARHQGALAPHCAVKSCTVTHTNISRHRHNICSFPEKYANGV